MGTSWTWVEAEGKGGTGRLERESLQFWGAPASSPFAQHARPAAALASSLPG